MMFFFGKKYTTISAKFIENRPNFQLTSHTSGGCLRIPSLKNACHPMMGTIHRNDPIQTNVMTTKARFLLLLLRYSRGLDMDQYRSRLSTSKLRMDAVLAEQSAESQNWHTTRPNLQLPVRTQAELIGMTTRPTVRSATARLMMNMLLT